MITGIEHFAIVAKDTKALKDWYQRVFDLDCVYDNGKGTYFLAFPDKSMLEFIPAESVMEEQAEKVSGVRHIALSVDDFEAMVDVLKKEGVTVIHDAATSAKGISTFFFRDIEGNILHLISRPEPLV